MCGWALNFFDSCFCVRVFSLYVGFHSWPVCCCCRVPVMWPSKSSGIRHDSLLDGPAGVQSGSRKRVAFEGNKTRRRSGVGWTKAEEEKDQERDRPNNGQAEKKGMSEQLISR